MKFPKITNFSAAIAAAILLAVCTATPARAQSGGLNVQTLPATATSTDGLLTMTMCAAAARCSVLVQLRVLGFSLLQNRDVGVGIFP